MSADNMLDLLLSISARCWLPVLLMAFSVVLPCKPKAVDVFCRGCRLSGAEDRSLECIMWPGQELHSSFDCALGINESCGGAQSAGQEAAEH